MPDYQQVTVDDKLVEKMSHERYLRAGRSSRSRVKIMLLAIGLAVTLLILLVVSIYSTSKISSLSGKKVDLERQLTTAETKIEALNPQVTQLRAQLSALVQNRFPNLHELKLNSMMAVNEGLITQVVFTKIKQGHRDVYKYLVVAENSTIKKTNPSFRVLLFDEFGVHIANADVIDKRVLKPGESRDYADELKLLFEARPKHFFIEDLSGDYKLGKK